MTDRGRVFSDAKAVDNRALNVLGVQPVRALLARLLYRLRSGSSDPLLQQLARDGFLLCEDFLPADLCDAMESQTREFIAIQDPTWLHVHGTTQVRHYVLELIDEQRFSYLAGWRYHERAQTLASAAERRRLQDIDGGSLVEHVTIGDYSQHDSQTDLHVDTFFHTHKLWLYLDDVTVKNAPFVYVPGSHLLDRTRLRGEYRASVNAEDEKSRRITDEELRRRGLAKRVMTCRRNTLLIANTCGYHARSVGEPGSTRLALHKSFRFNPFNPFTRPPWKESRLKSGVHRVRRPVH